MPERGEGLIKPKNLGLILLTSIGAKIAGLFVKASKEPSGSLLATLK